MAAEFVFLDTRLCSFPQYLALAEAMFSLSVSLNLITVLFIRAAFCIFSRHTDLREAVENTLRSG
jgi:hypothetical protein